MNAYRMKPLAFPWPPLIYGAAIAAAFLLQAWFPLAVSDTNIWIARAAGGVLIVTAIVLDVWAMRTLLDNHTTIMPNRCSTHLVTSGPYRFTRNPIYLGYTLATAGMGLAMLNPWCLVTATVAAAVTSIIAIKREELHLLSRFGIDFERYCTGTSRWI
ncbi:MAG TPA: isoprenylcysteine carboxylmethyltransferase family protein [Shinella sp.]|jgi:protein-S-isoprenylcysteine O-methyltransferase Ste14|uniref:methyltransferase family protein n=1 Tax=Shinella sp. TaxID=1870904 RepID=UPI0029B16EED|nr:isoprenylcysteine carboxylmethyltransferase family protein [Shinella sp.]MDX3976793.1 isoprenylcysteine carboxylmethyltransferase family protein [Shinella sp.]HEV7250802.1 isoprenylcysteine carboxylmethyltransferase family protein [Shinella sp.]